ncbi:M48 family metallopeptidase [Parapusillimonas granuli]|uniref:M48 family metallopeptidase n=1 Tax=Parapusillimonas granuli TaxID=380911 RepID=A0A853G590_9BURK|nr:M48 family metallopeptidase [Parapusillimonas granuli]MBB5217087.1 STE24 endopeptidase [Parapusillimonas granuli]MEB2400583.1 M48 family metallopeptidase [Alcaligenaceae bacterium]NYT50150.1 M48 family metallopeptidase [Parapusillimonas granuli]
MFTSLFVAFLLADILTGLWLASRQIRHVQKHRDTVPPEFADRIGLHSHQRAADYTIAKMQFSMVERVTEAAVLVGFTLLGGLQFLDHHLGVLIDNEMLRQLMLLAAVLAIMGLIGLPFSAWRKFKLEARFGFNRITPRLFIQDNLKTLALTLLLGTPLAAGVLWFMGNAGSSWVWWAWGLWVGFNFLILWLFPTVIAPLFNKFTPLDNPEIAERIQGLAKRCGFSLSGLFVMDGSKRSAHGNAYFTGFGNARRIVFFDTLLSRLNVDEVEAVLAHELGHFSHKHIIKRMAVSFAVALAFLLLLGWLSNQTWFYVGLGVLPQLGRPNDALALILLFLAVPVFTFWATPLASWLSRRDEFQADRYAARQCPPDRLVSALVKLYDDNAATLTPDPIHSAYYDSHPPAVIRIQKLKHG